MKNKNSAQSTYVLLTANGVPALQCLPKFKFSKDFKVLNQLGTAVLSTAMSKLL